MTLIIFGIAVYLAWSGFQTGGQEGFLCLLGAVVVFLMALISAVMDELNRR